MQLPITLVEWRPAWRIIPSVFPPVSLFDRVADPADLEAVFALEAMTNERLRDEVGELQLVPPEERISGEGTSTIMAAFTHLKPEGSRFSSGAYGVFYASSSCETAIAETRYHREQFLRATNEAAIELDMRVYKVNLKGHLHDARGARERFTEIYHLSDYRPAQHFAHHLRERQSQGILYHSVRHEEGTNAAIFRPKLLTHCRQERHLCYCWNGREIHAVYEKKSM